MKRIHIEGYGNEIDLLEKFSDNYDLGIDFEYENESSDTIDNVSLQIYESNKPCSLEEAKEGFLNQIDGVLLAVGQAYGYSEYTIEGFSVTSMRIGGHDLVELVKSKKDKYLHIIFEQIKD